MWCDGIARNESSSGSALGRETCGWSWTKPARYATRRITKGIWKPAWSGLKAGLCAQLNEQIVEENMRKAVPDYARWPEHAKKAGPMNIGGKRRGNEMEGGTGTRWAREDRAEMNVIDGRERELAAREIEAERGDAESQSDANSARSKRVMARR